MVTLVDAWSACGMLFGHYDLLLAGAITPTQGWGRPKKRSRCNRIDLMPKMSHTREDHGDAMLVAGGDYFIVIL